MNGPRQLVRRGVDGDLALLHALEQAGLGLRRGAVDLVDDHDVGEDRAGPELEPRLALVVDVGADDVGRQQVGRALHARELRSRSSATARAPARSCRRPGSPRRGCAPRRAATTMTCSSTSSRDLDGRAGCCRRSGRRPRPPPSTCCGATVCSASGVGSRGSIQRGTFMSEDERRLKTASRMAVATSAFEARGTWRSASGVTTVTSFSRGVEADAGRADVVDDDGVEVLAVELLARRRRAPRRRARRRSRPAADRGGGGRRASRARPLYVRDAARVPRRPRPS